jgi:FkbM family methyltransferase
VIIFRIYTFPERSVIVDCLANVGCDSMYLSSFFKKVYSLETRKDEYDALVHNIDLYQKHNNTNNIVTKKTNLISFVNDLNDRKSDELKQIVFYVNLEFTDHNNPPVLGDFDIRYLDKLKLEDLLKIIRESVTENYYVVIKHPRAFPIRKIHSVFGYEYGRRNTMVHTASKEIDGCIASIVYVKPIHESSNYIIRKSGYVNYNFNFEKLTRDNEIENLLYFQDMKIFNEKDEQINHFKLEIDEQMIVPRYVKPDDVVLEFGARYGSVSCMINQKLANPKDHVCVEPDKTVWKALEKNRQINYCYFQILKGFVSNTKQKMVGLNAWNGYGARSIETNETNSGDPPSYTLNEVKKKYGLKFNVFVADCEGCLEKFFDENPTFYDELRLFIFERDYPETCNYPKIEKELIKRGFKAIITGHQNVYEREYIPVKKHRPPEKFKGLPKGTIRKKSSNQPNQTNQSRKTNQTKKIAPERIRKNIKPRTIKKNQNIN